MKRPNLLALGDDVSARVRRNFDELRLYFEELFRTGSAGIDHSQLSGVYGANPTSSDPTLIRHVSNLQAKGWQDHVTATSGVHGRTGELVGTTDEQYLLNKKFGAGANYSEFEGDGTLRFSGEATVYDDLPPVPILSLRPAGAGADPALDAFRGGTSQYTFALADEVQGSIELVHSYKEGTVIKPHVHWVTNGEEAVDKAVRWGLEYTLMNATPDFSGAFPDTVTIYTDDVTIPAGTPDRSSHIVGYNSDITAAGIKIGAYLVFRFFRAALLGAGSAPAANPFALAVGFHVEQDTVGSRQLYLK